MTTFPESVANFLFRIFLWILAFVAFVVIANLFFGNRGVGLDAPQRAQAKNDVTQIATAVTAYETEYGRFPSTNSGFVGGEALAALLGAKSDLNPRQITFLEVQVAKKNKSGLSNGIFVDPWGGAYQIAYDHDGDGRVRGGTNAKMVAKKVAVWNDPRSGRPERDERKRLRRYVTSWE